MILSKVEKTSENDCNFVTTLIKYMLVLLVINV